MDDKQINAINNLDKTFSSPDLTALAAAVMLPPASLEALMAMAQPVEQRRGGSGPRSKPLSPYAERLKKKHRKMAKVSRRINRRK